MTKEEKEKIIKLIEKKIERLSKSLKRAFKKVDFYDEDTMRKLAQEAHDGSPKPKHEIPFKLGILIVTKEYLEGKQPQCIGADNLIIDCIDKIKEKMSNRKYE